MPNPLTAGMHVMVKPAGAACNLDCRYCFYLSKEVFYPGSSLRMGEELLETYTHPSLL